MFLISMLHADTAQAVQNPIMQFIPLILVMGVLYFFMIRPQSKKADEHKKMLEALKKGDTVVTSSGIIGVINTINDSEITLEVYPDVHIKHLKTSILSKYDGKAAKAAVQKDKGSKSNKDKE
ncbi:MAG: hypothetical protein HEEMFOPI_00501 [Holosporales bacterium]